MALVAWCAPPRVRLWLSQVMFVSLGLSIDWNRRIINIRGVQLILSVIWCTPPRVRLWLSQVTFCLSALCWLMLVKVRIINVRGRWSVASNIQELTQSNCIHESVMSILCFSVELCFFSGPFTFFKMIFCLHQHIWESSKSFGKQFLTSWYASCASSISGQSLKALYPLSTRNLTPQPCCGLLCEGKAAHDLVINSAGCFKDGEGRVVV